jgi:hypothetical protein
MKINRNESGKINQLYHNEDNQRDLNALKFFSEQSISRIEQLETQKQFGQKNVHLNDYDSTVTKLFPFPSSTFVFEGASIGSLSQFEVNYYSTSGNILTLPQFSGTKTFCLEADLTFNFSYGTEGGLLTYDSKVSQGFDVNEVVYHNGKFWRSLVAIPAGDLAEPGSSLGESKWQAHSVPSLLTAQTFMAFAFGLIPQTTTEYYGFTKSAICDNPGVVFDWDQFLSQEPILFSAYNQRVTLKKYVTLTQAYSGKSVKFFGFILPSTQTGLYHHFTLQFLNLNIGYLEV